MYERVFILEISGPTLDFILDRISHLPNFKHFLEHGAWSRLIGPLQPAVPTSFATLHTGKNPGKTGLFDSFKFAAGGYRRALCNADVMIGEPFYQRLSDGGKRVGLLNVPLTYPLPEVNGFVVSGDEGIGSEYAYPSEVLQMLQNTGYFVPFGESYSPGRELAFFKHSMEVLAMRRRALHMLFEDRRWQFGMLTLYMFGELMHAFWKFYDQRHPDYYPVTEMFGSTDPFLEGLKAIDQILGDIKDLAGPEGLVLMLGAWGHRLEHSRVHLNELLEQIGYLRFRRTIGSYVKRLLCQMGFTASRLERLSHRLNLYKLFRYKLASGKRSAVTGTAFLSYQDIDWTRTKAVAMGYLGQIYLNLRGHRPLGAIAESDYELERDRLYRLLMEIHDPDKGEPIVKRVYNREDIYHGAELGNAPDIVVKFRKGYTGDSGFSGRGNLVTKSPPNNSSEHFNESVLLAIGKGIKPGEVQSQLEDIAPTVLHALGVEVSSDYDGKVLPIFV
jgi:predicted AlkP superfamily phosphohydrolase/phosphomutase